MLPRCLCSRQEACSPGETSIRRRLEELIDALEPSVLDDLIETHVTELTNPDMLLAAQRKQREHVMVLRKAARRWDEVVEFLNKEE